MTRYRKDFNEELTEDAISEIKFSPAIQIASANF